MGAKKDGEVDTVSFTMVMPCVCQGCAGKAKSSVMMLHGVESVQVDITDNKLKVTGKVDPMEVKNHVELETKKKVEIFAPAKKDKASDSGAGKKEEGKSSDKKSNDERKVPTKEKESTVDLKIRLHCQHCVSKTKKILFGISGVKGVSINESNDQITVKGTMPENLLVQHLERKLRKKVDIVPSKKDDGKKQDKSNGEKKVDGCSGDKKSEKKPKESNDGEKKKENDPQTDKKQSDGKKKEDASRLEVGRMECYGQVPAQSFYWFPTPGGYGQNYYANNMEHHTGTGYCDMQQMMYPNQMQPPDQIFSDENPNACSIM